MCEISADEPVAVIDPNALREAALAVEAATLSLPAELLAAATQCRTGLASLSEHPSGRSALRKKAHDCIDEWLKTVNSIPQSAFADTAPLHKVHHALEKFADMFRYEPLAE
jgi:hypothetical protein